MAKYVEQGSGRIQVDTATELLAGDGTYPVGTELLALDTGAEYIQELSGIALLSNSASAIGSALATASFLTSAAAVTGVTGMVTTATSIKGAINEVHNDATGINAAVGNLPTTLATAAFETALNAVTGVTGLNAALSGSASSIIGAINAVWAQCSGFTGY